jgi:hypothetical protein
MQSSSNRSDVPTTGAALLVTSTASAEQVAKVLMLAVTGYAEVLRRQPTTFVFRLPEQPTALVFCEPAPKVVVDLFVDLLNAEVKPTKLEELVEPFPLMRLSAAGIRLYLSAEGLADARA